MLELQPYIFWVIACLTGLCAIATVVTQNIVRSATWLLFTLAGTSGIFFLLGADLVGATQLLVYVGGTLILVVFGVMLTAQGPFISMKTSGAEWAISVGAGLLLLGVLVTQAVIPEKSIGAPKVRGMLSTSPDPDHPDRTHKTLTLKMPEVEQFAPKLSRSQRQSGKHLLPTSGPLPSEIAKKYEAPKKGGPGKGAEPPDASDKGDAKVPARKKDAPLAPPDLVDPATSPQSAVLGQGFLGVGVGPAHRDGNTRNIIRTGYLLPFELVSIHLLVVLIGAAYLARAKRHQGDAS